MRKSRVSLIVSVCCLAAGTAAADDLEPNADRILRDMSARLRDAETASVDVAYQLRITAEGMLQEWNSRYAIAFRRPNKLAINLEYGIFGATIVSDGETVYAHMASMGNQYTAEKAPASMGEIDQTALMSAGVYGWTVFAVLTADDPYENLVDQVDGGRYAGEELLDGVPCHKLVFSQADVDWTLWVQAGEIPAPVKVAVDLTTEFAYPGVPSMRADASFDFTDWRFDTDLPADRFSWTPPEDAELVDSFYDESMFAEEEHDLTGTEAPTFKLGLLGGGGMDLEDHLGKDIVILDFWATWCGPCVAAMPVLIEVAEAFKDRGVKLYAVNQGEPVETVRRFLEEKEMELTVALDVDERVGDLYGVTAIPHTTIIGADGIVQVVHIGFHPDLKETLSGELDALLAGESLAERKEAEPAYEPEGLTAAWTDESPWRAVATDGAVAYAMSDRGRCTVFDDAGNVQRSFIIQAPSGVLLAANLVGDERRELLAFSSWGDVVTAHDTEGDELWRYGGGDGINDVWPVDLDGDGLDEVIVGYNGGTGLHVVDNRGTARWKYTGIGNVWHVCGGDVTGDGKPEVVTTSATGQVHLFTGFGDKLLDLDVPVYAGMVRIGPDERIIVGGTGNRGEVLLAVSASGRSQWSLELPAQINQIISMHVAREQPWIAVGMEGGLVQVIEASSGEVIAGIDGQGMQPQVAWLEGPSPVLVVATGRALNAYTVEPSEVP